MYESTALPTLIQIYLVFYNFLFTLLTDFFKFPIHLLWVVGLKGFVLPCSLGIIWNGVISVLLLLHKGVSLAKFKLPGLLMALEVGSASLFSSLLSKFGGILPIFVFIELFFSVMTLTEGDSFTLGFLDMLKEI